MVLKNKAVIDYFRKYWSVGIYRVVLDLKSDGEDAESCKGVVRALVKKGYLVYKDGVLSATKKFGQMFGEEKRCEFCGARMDLYCDVMFCTNAGCGNAEKL